MVKKKEKKMITPEEEMRFSAQEVAETLPTKYIKEEPSKETSPSQKEESDYLMDYQPQGQNIPKDHSQPLMFNDEGKENLIVDLLKVDWERVEHIIRGHKPKVSPDGTEYFVKIDDHYLNDNGVNSILHFLSFYLSKDIKLGRYSGEQVQIIMKNFAKQFTDFFYDNIEEFGLNTPKKKKMSKMFVQSVIDLVDASYSCAIEGKTIELMLKQFQVLQQQPLFDGDFSPSGNNLSKPKPTIRQRIFG